MAAVMRRKRGGREREEKIFRKRERERERERRKIERSSRDLRRWWVFLRCYKINIHLIQIYTSRVYHKFATALH
jgi:hypothetical protein